MQDQPSSRSVENTIAAQKYGIGQPVVRKEDDTLVRGKGKYTDDLDLPGQAYAVIVRSTHAHGVLKQVDTAAAKKLPGVLGIWTGEDMVAAIRQSGYGEPLIKRLGTRLFYRIANASSPVPIPAGAGDFRLMDRRVVDALKSLPERNRFMKGLYAWVGFETLVIPYTPLERQAGRSTFSLRRLAHLALVGVTAFSNFPLRVWSGVGALIAVAAMAYGLWIVIEHFVVGHPLPGWATLVTGLMFFSGVQLLSIGILGEYIGRIFDEVKQRPVYLLGSETGRGTLGRPAAGEAGAPEQGRLASGQAVSDTAPAPAPAPAAQHPDVLL